MGSTVFPSRTLVGLAWPVLREGGYSTIVNRSASGMELRTSLYSNGLDKWTLSFAYLARGVQDPYPWSQADYQTLMGHFRAVRGMGDSFLFDDVNDDVSQGQPCLNTVTLGTTGDGSTTTFQLQRQMATAVDLIYDVNSNSVNSLGQSGVNGAVVTSGGSGYSFAYVSFSGGGGTGARGYAIVSGGSVAQVVLLSSGAGYTSAPAISIRGDGTGAAATAVIAPRIYFDSALQTSGYTIGQTGVVTFGSAPPNGVAVTADLAWFWRTRYDSDQLEFSNDFQSFLSCKKVVLQQTRN